MIRIVGRLAVVVMTAPIRLYQLLVSPVLPATCRFYPSCSHYAIEALRGHGPLRGAWLAITRLARCHPWSRGGTDPVPPSGPKPAAARRRRQAEDMQTAP